MGSVSVILSFAHPLATVLFASLWTLHILRRDYRHALEETGTASEPDQDERAHLQGE